MNSSAAIEEARRHQRFPANAKIRIRRTDGSGREYDGLCTDVSLSGIGAEVPAEFEVGEVVEFRFVDSEYGDSGCYRARIIYRNSRDHYGMYMLRAC